MEQQKHCYEFFIEKKNGIVTRIGKGSLQHPKIKFGGGHIKWLEDIVRNEEGEQKNVFEKN